MVVDQSAASTLTIIAQQYGPMLSAGAILVSAAVALIVAKLTISMNRKIARRRATLDLLAQQRWDKDYLCTKQEFIKIRDGEGGLVKWSDKQYRNTLEINHIRNMLNDYELVSVGIKNEILDEKLYKEWFESSFTKDWKESKSFIMELRRSEQRDKLFKEFKWLARKWVRIIVIESILIWLKRTVI
jgi:hypothetical protein